MLLLRKDKRGFSDSQLANPEYRKTYYDHDSGADSPLPRKTSRDESGKSFQLSSALKTQKVLLANLRKTESSTIEEESVGTKTSLDSDCTSFCEKIAQLGITTPPLRQSQSYLINKLTLLDEKGGQADQTKPSSRETLDSENTSTEAISLVLPTCKNSKHPDLNTISLQTLIDLMNDPKDNNYLIIDCRYDYEYNGGHIKGAIHVDSLELLEKIFFTHRKLLENKTFIEDLKTDLKGTLENFEKYETSETDSNMPIIIFHCEFSQVRGPRAFKTLRNQDRKLNHFPNLYYSQIYVLDGGYCEFHKQFPTYSEPENSYVAMEAENYVSEFAVAREKATISWKRKMTFDISPSPSPIEEPKTLKSDLKTEVIKA